MILRKYKVKDVDMVIAITAIVMNAKGKQEFLQTKRTTFTREYFTDFETEIDDVIQRYLGADNAKQLRESSMALYASQEEALNLAAEIKLQIELDFEKNEAEMLNNLGFTAYYQKARKKDQEALINLLYRFKTNMTPAIKTEMIANGTIPADIEALIAKADEFKATDTSQESYKANKPIVTQEAIKAFNTIYKKAIGIARLSSRFYKGDKAHQNLFSFSRISKTINASPKNTPILPAT